MTVKWVYQNERIFLILVYKGPGKVLCDATLKNQEAKHKLVVMDLI